MQQFNETVAHNRIIASSQSDTIQNVLQTSVHVGRSITIGNHKRKNDKNARKELLMLQRCSAKVAGDSPLNCIEAKKMLSRKMLIYV